MEIQLEKFGITLVSQETDNNIVIIKRGNRIEIDRSDMIEFIDSS